MTDSSAQESIPKEINRIQLPLTIPIHPYLLDHNFDGKIILPAVEILQNLAESVLAHIPSANVKFMSHASFDRFLPIKPGASLIEATNKIILYENGLVSSNLVTMEKTKSGITRNKEHASVCFSGTVPRITALPADINALPEGNCFEIPAHGFYAELVPFGPSFQTVKGNVILSESGAITRVDALEYPCASGPLGSPFPFDGALHAACAWCQRYCGIVAFPVGFDERVIVQLIDPGETIFCRIVPISVQTGFVRFEICLHDLGNELRELIKGVVMKDVSGGRITPPRWILSETTY
jgi:hypothetical protein